MAIFKGVGVAIVTPMNQDLSVNYEKLAEASPDEQIAGGTDAIIICGTTGESRHPHSSGASGCDTICDQARK